MNPLELHPAGGYFMEAPPAVDTPICTATDPAHDFRWHSFNCGGPEVATFICELPVTFLPEQAAIELTSDCGLDGTRRIACKGQANRDEMMRQLSCATDDSGDSTTMQTSSGTAGSVQPWTADEPPTRHRRDASQTAACRMPPRRPHDSSSPPTDPTPSPTSRLTSTTRSDPAEKTSQSATTAATTTTSEGTGTSTVIGDLMSTFTPDTTSEILLTTGFKDHQTIGSMKNTTDAESEPTGTPYLAPVINSTTDTNKTHIPFEVNVTVEVNEDRKQHDDPLREAADTRDEHTWTEVPSEDTMEVLEAEPEAPAASKQRQKTDPATRKVILPVLPQQGPRLRAPHRINLTGDGPPTSITTLCKPLLVM